MNAFHGTTCATMNTTVRMVLMSRDAVNSCAKRGPNYHTFPPVSASLAFLVILFPVHCSMPSNIPVPCLNWPDRSPFGSDCFLAAVLSLCVLLQQSDAIAAAAASGAEASKNIRLLSLLHLLECQLLNYFNTQSEGSPKHCSIHRIHNFIERMTSPRSYFFGENTSRQIRGKIFSRSLYFSRRWRHFADPCFI